MQTDPRFRDRAADGGVPAEMFSPAAELEELLVHGGAAVVATDLDGIITHWSAAAERLYGWTGAEAIGRPILEMMVFPDDRRTAEENFESISRDGLWEGEFVVGCKDGGSVQVYIRSTVIKDDLGRSVGILGLSMVVSEPPAA